MDDATLARFREYTQYFEKLSVEFQKNAKEAEKGFLQFRKLPDVIPLCRFILENTNFTAAQFQALITLRDCLLQDWINVSTDDKASIRTFLFQYVFHPNKKIESVVEKQALQTIAIICKRGWFEGGQQAQINLSESLFNPLTMILEDVSQEETAARRKHVALHLMAALVDEFSYTKSNYIGLSWEYHHQCFQTFQQSELRRIFTLTLNLTRKLITTSPLSSPSVAPTWWTKEGLTLKEALKLMVEVLSWRFEETPLLSTLSITFKDFMGTHTTITPGENWRDLLIKGDALDFFIKLYEPLRVPELSHLILTGITQFASLSGTIFEDETSKLTFLSRVVTGSLNLLKAPSSVGVVEIADISQLVYRISTNFRLPALLQIPNLLQPFIMEYTNFTMKCLNLLRSTTDPEFRTEIEECFNTLLDAWAILLGDQMIQEPQIAAFMKEFTSKIFHTYVETRLAVAKTELDEEIESHEDEQVYQDHLTSIAFIGRFDALSTLNVLNGLLDARLKNFEEYLQRGSQSGVNILLVSEELHWLVLITGNVLADIGEGETPQIPVSLNALSKAFEGKGVDPVVTVASNVFKLIQYANQCVTGNYKEAVSPLLGKTLASFMNRWCKTYLMLDPNDVSPSIIKSYGSQEHGGNGNQALDFILRTILINLEKWEEEKDITIESCRVLLTISKLKHPPKYIMSLSSWNELLRAYLSSHPLLAKLPTVAQRLFMQSLVGVTNNVGGDASDSDQRRAQYFNEVMKPLVGGFTGLLQRDFMKTAQNAQVIFMLQTYLERLRGVARSLLEEPQLAIGFCTQYFATFTGLLDVYKNNPEVYNLIFKFYCDFTEYQADNLEQEQANVLFASVVELFKKYSAFNLGKVRSKSASSESEQEAYKDILTLLKLLCIMSGFSNMFDEVQDVIFIGLSILLPLITKELLEFPKLCATYFTLVCLMFQDCPHKVASLPSNLFKHVVTSLQYGVNHPDVETSRKSLEAIASMARFNFTNRIENGTEGFQNDQAAILSQMLHFLLNFLMYNDFSPELLPAIADSILCLMCSEYKIFGTVVQQVIDAQTDPNLKHRLGLAFNALLSTNQIKPSIDRHNMENFRTNIETFVASVKSFLLRK